MEPTSMTVDIGDLDIDDDQMLSLLNNVNSSTRVLNIESNFLCHSSTVEKIITKTISDQNKQIKINISANYLADQEFNVLFQRYQPLLVSNPYYGGISSKIDDNKKISVNNPVLSLIQKREKGEKEEKRQRLLVLETVNLYGQLSVSTSNVDIISWSPVTTNIRQFFYSLYEIPYVSINVSTGMSLDLTIDTLLDTTKMGNTELQLSSVINSDVMNKRLNSLEQYQLYVKLRLVCVLGNKEQINKLSDKVQNINMMSRSLKRSPLHMAILNKREDDIITLLFNKSKAQCLQTGQTELTGWQKWKGRVLGSDAEIQAAYEKLGPTVTWKQLEDEIFNKRTQNLSLSLEDSRTYFW